MLNIEEQRIADRVATAVLLAQFNFRTSERMPPDDCYELAMEFIIARRKAFDKAEADADADADADEDMDADAHLSVQSVIDVIKQCQDRLDQESH